MIEDKLFWEKVEKKENGCWEWTGARYKSGYGQLKRYKLAKNAISAHRYVWYLKYGKFPDDMLCHKCDNPPCVNPDHLFEGTHQDNMDDMVKKGRHNSPDQAGKANGNSVLNDTKVIEIKELIKEGLNNTEIAAEYGVTHSNISCIRRGKSWKHI